MIIGLSSRDLAATSSFGLQVVVEGLPDHILFLLLYSYIRIMIRATYLLPAHALDYTYAYTQYIITSRKSSPTFFAGDHVPIYMYVYTESDNCAAGAGAVLPVSALHNAFMTGFS